MFDEPEVEITHQPRSRSRQISNGRSRGEGLLVEMRQVGESVTRPPPLQASSMVSWLMEVSGLWVKYWSLALAVVSRQEFPQQRLWCCVCYSSIHSGTFRIMMVDSCYDVSQSSLVFEIRGAGMVSLSNNGVGWSEYHSRLHLQAGVQPCPFSLHRVLREYYGPTSTLCRGY